jgi:hypothetical protein
MCAVLTVEVPDLDLYIGTLISGSLEGPHRLEAASKPFHSLFQFNILHYYAAQIWILVILHIILPALLKCHL